MTLPQDRLVVCSAVVKEHLRPLLLLGVEAPSVPLSSACLLLPLVCSGVVVSLESREELTDLVEKVVPLYTVLRGS